MLIIMQIRMGEETQDEVTYDTMKKAVIASTDLRNIHSWERQKKECLEGLVNSELEQIVIAFIVASSISASPT